MSPLKCSVLLEVFEPVTIYDDNPDVVAWAVSTDPAHEFPYLLAPRNYAEQEIDPIRCTVSIGTVEVGVIDPPVVPGEQSTGWMTARVHDLLGRRCRLRRWIDDDAGWQVIADGPAGPPRMDASYAAYRWVIRDTREVERKLPAFLNGGTSGISPRGSLYDWGHYKTEEDGPQVLLSGLLNEPSSVALGDEFSIKGIFKLSTLGMDGVTIGYLDLVPFYVPGGPIVPPLTTTNKQLIDEKGLNAVELVELLPNVMGARNADLLWRVTGTTTWNVARYTTSTNVRWPFVIAFPVLELGTGIQKMGLLNVSLFSTENDEGIPDGFPTEEGTSIDFIIRYRGPASEDYPYYIEGPLGEVLQNVYAGVYTRAPTTGIEGLQYDPGGFDSVESDVIRPILTDPDAFDALVEDVLLRQTDPIEDVRAWAETTLYGPSGWMPTLDNSMRLSPVSRVIPSETDPAELVADSVTSPSASWVTGERTVSEIIYTYPRYFKPLVSDVTTKRGSDGIAIREVSIGFEDVEAALRYGEQIETYDATAFGAVGDAEGVNLPGVLETASLLAQQAKFDVLDRYRAGAQTIAVSVLRSRIPNIRPGSWVPWNLMYLPDRLTGLRGSDVIAAQVIALRDDDCTWRTLVLEEAPLSDGPPGYFDPLVLAGDDTSAGFFSLEVTGDEESY